MLAPERGLLVILSVRYAKHLEDDSLNVPRFFCAYISKKTLKEQKAKTEKP